MPTATEIQDDIASKITNEIEEEGIEPSEVGGILSDMVDLTEEKVPQTRTVAGHALTGNVTLVKADVGLDNADNTSDANKPVSTAQQTALDGKATKGGDAGAALILGTTDTNPVSLKQANIERFGIGSNGVMTATANNSNGVVLHIKNAAASADNNWALGIGTASSANNSEFSIWRGAARMVDITGTAFRMSSLIAEINGAAGYAFTGGNPTSGAAVVISTTLSGINNQTLGDLALLSLGNATAGSFRPNSGNAAWAWAKVDGTINQTGTASGITRGVYINPTLTAAADWRSLEIANNAHWAIYQSGASAKNYLNGNTIVGSSTDDGAKLQVAGDISLKNAGNKLKIKTGSNATIGNATLVAGTVTVNTSAVTANSLIFLSVSTPGGTQGILSYAVSAGVSFTINSSNAADTSTVNWLIIDTQ